MLYAACLLLAFPACQDKTQPPKPRYETRTNHDPDGIGKFYMGREIAQVMGHLAAGWLERPSARRRKPRASS